MCGGGRTFNGSCDCGREMRELKKGRSTGRNGLDEVLRGVICGENCWDIGKGESDGCEGFVQRQGLWRDFEFLCIFVSDHTSTEMVDLHTVVQLRPVEPYPTKVSPKQSQSLAPYSVLLL